MSLHPPLKIVIIARDERPHVQQAADQIYGFLKSQPQAEVIGVAIAGDDELHQEDADLALVVGGDGAILRACRQFATRQIPVLGINLGRLGFLANATLEEFQNDFEAIATRDYLITNHLMYHCRIVCAKHNVQEYVGLNEVAICSAASLGMIDVRLRIDQEDVTTYSGDGVLISTPVGSTAHSLSAGGPILRQDMEAFVITPICPHTLSIRPIVDRADSVYQLTVMRSPRGGVALLDGQESLPLEEGDCVEVRKASVCFQLVRLPCHNFYKALNKKLGWDGKPRYRESL